MPKRDPDLLIGDILTAIRKIQGYTAETNESLFRQDEKTIDAVVRNLEIIGEAARHLPESLLERNQEIPWRQIAGMRNRIVHDYAGVDIELVWQVIRYDLPKLKSQLEAIAMGEL